jgi:antitoxin VapB
MVIIMNTAKIFTNGRSQAVRLPKEYRFSSDSVYVKKIDDMVILIPKDTIWDNFTKSLDKFPENFLTERNQLDAQERESLK